MRQELISQLKRKHPKHSSTWNVFFKFCTIFDIYGATKLFLLILNAPNKTFAHHSSFACGIYHIPAFPSPIVIYFNFQPCSYILGFGIYVSVTMHTVPAESSGSRRHADDWTATVGWLQIHSLRSERLAYTQGRFKWPLADQKHDGPIGRQWLSTQQSCVYTGINSSEAA